MIRAALALTLAAVPVLSPALSPALADPVAETEIVLDGGAQRLPARVAAPDWLADRVPVLMSGWLFRDAATRAMQTDDFENPGIALADQGAAAWDAPAGAAGPSCRSCHGDLSAMAGVRAKMPRMAPAGDDLWSLENFVNACRTARMGLDPWPWTGPEMTAMTAAISLQSRGMPVAVAIDGPARAWWERGRVLYETRFGQLEFACANCHEERAGRMIRADHLSQGQINGFPTYRLKDGALVSIHQRFTGCIRDTRAETFAPGSAELRALELYVASRGTGLPVEGVAVRQ